MNAIAAGERAGEAGRHTAVVHLKRDQVVTVGRSPSCDVVISHSTISRQHAKLTRQGAEVWLEDLDASHGTRVNDAPVRKVILRPGDVVRFGSAATYRFTGDSLNVQDGVGAMSIELAKVEIERDDRKLLEDICVSISPDRFVAILGPSGAGKSLLLHCLASTVQPTGGQVLFDDGMRVLDALDDYRAMIGVVTQDDLVYSYLTVEENLRFSAQLRMPAADIIEINRRVRDALELVGLEIHLDKRVDVLSGGQRKRVGVAIELLLRPRLLLLDEPTSGLDPGTTAQIMGMLRRLSRQGMTVVCTTHTTETLHFFDTAIVLGIQAGVGRIAFDGAPGELMATFRVGNTADLFDRLQDLDRSHVPAAERRTRSFSGTRSTGSFCPMPLRRRPEGRYLAHQIAIVAQRSLLGFLRDRPNFVVAFVQPLVLTLVIIFSQHPHDRSVFINFYMLISSLWLGMTLTVREAVRERTLYVRDRIASLSPDAYIAGKLSYALMLCCVQSLILVITSRILVRVMIPSSTFAGADILKGSWALALVVLTLCSFGGAMIGLIISVIASSERTAVAMLPLAILPQMLLSRVSFGEGSEGWGKNSPFGAVVDLAIYLHSKDANFLGGLESILSLPLLSRPGTTVLDMPLHNGFSWTIVGAEWLYFTLLLLTHLLVLYVLVGAMEKKWLKLR